MGLFTRLPTVLDWMSREHRRIHELFGAIEESTDRDERRELLGRLAGELLLHKRLEDEVFYPAFRKALEGRAEEMLYHEAMQERHVVEVLLSELRAVDPASADFSAKARVLEELVRGQLEHEERRLFPLAKREMTRPHLTALAERMAERHAEIVAVDAEARPDRSPSGPERSPGR